jgi:hypothetical protein
MIVLFAALLFFSISHLQAANQQRNPFSYNQPQEPQLPEPSPQPLELDDSDKQQPPASAHLWQQTEIISTNTGDVAIFKDDDGNFCSVKLSTTAQ